MHFLCSKGLKRTAVVIFLSRFPECAFFPIFPADVPACRSCGEAVVSQAIYTQDRLIETLQFVLLLLLLHGARSSVLKTFFGRA